MYLNIGQATALGNVSEATKLQSFEISLGKINSSIILNSSKLLMYTNSDRQQLGATLAKLPNLFPLKFL